MAGAASASGFSMEVFVEEHEVAPVRVSREAAVRPVAGAVSVLGAQEQPCKSSCQFFGDFGEVLHLAGTGRKLDAKIVAVKVVIAFESFYQEVVQREPNWPAPVRVAAEE